MFADYNPLDRYDNVHPKTKPQEPPKRHTLRVSPVAKDAVGRYLCTYHPAAKFTWEERDFDTYPTLVASPRILDIARAIAWTVTQYNHPHPA